MKPINDFEPEHVVFSTHEAGLRSSDLDEIATLLNSAKISTIYAGERELTYMSSRYPEFTFGLMVGSPFGGITKEHALYMIGQSAGILCDSIIVTLNSSLITTGKVNEIISMVQAYTSACNKVSCSLTIDIPAGNLTLGQLKQTIDICSQVGIQWVCLGSGTKLDILEEEYILYVKRHIAESTEKGKIKLEIPINNKESLKQVIASEDRLRICGLSTLKKYIYYMQTLPEVLHD